MAPPIDGRDWLTSDPIPWSSLRGRAVLIVFWSYGCEASLLRLRQVEAIADRAGESLVAIAVHTPRFPYEEHLSQVESAVTQHRIGIPVVHDPDFLTWNAYNPEGWPATAVVDARGRVLGMQSGAGDAEVLLHAVGLALNTATASTRKSVEVNVVPKSAPRDLPDNGLAFPTGVAAAQNGDLIVADFGNNRLLVFEMSADVRTASAVTEIDGFDNPYGVVANGEHGVYVSEPSLGCISHLDLAERTRQLLTDDLAAPTGMCRDSDGSLVITDPGADKIYRLIHDGGSKITIGLIAGSGDTGSADGTAAQAELAQPTGVARTEVGIVFCDAAASNIRLLTDSGKVATITGNGFFEWGLVDGPAHKAMLQRPSDLTVLDDGSLVIVDTGNNRLRRLANRRIRTLGLSGLNRPAGICRLPTGHLVVADTGNNRLVVIDTDLHTAWPLSLRGLSRPARSRDGMAPAT